MKKLIPIILIVAAFAYFATRERESRQPEGDPEDVLFTMVRAIGKGDIERLLDTFGGELGQRLQSLANSQRASALQDWVDQRRKAVKGFAVLRKEAKGNDEIIVFTETIYPDKNTKQTFTLRQEGGVWKIVDTDFEMVSDWETNFGRPVSGVQE